MINQFIKYTVQHFYYLRIIQKKIKLLLIIYISFFSYSSYSQPAITQQSCYETSGTDFFADALIANDGGFVAVAEFGGTDGIMLGQDSMVYPATLLKFDSGLNLQWIKNYGGGPSGSGFQQIKSHKTIGYTIAGVTADTGGDFQNNHGLYDILLLSVDNLGNKIWSKTYGSPGNDYFESFIETMDGGYLLAGYSYSSGGDIPFHYGEGFSEDAILIKTDSIGEIEWVKDFGGTGNDAPLTDIIELKRGYYIVNIGSYSDDFDLSGSGIEGGKRWFIEVDSLGNIVNENFISGTDDFNIFGGDQLILNNNKIFIAGAGNPLSTLFPETIGHGGNYDGALAMFDTTLEFTDLRLWGGSQTDILKRICVDEFNNYYLLGYSKSNDGNLPDNYNDGEAYDYWIMKTDNDFNLYWSKNFGGSDECGDLDCSVFNGKMIINNNKLYLFIKNVVPSSLPDFDIACGALGVGNSDAWIVVFDLSTDIETEINTVFNVYPNPSADYFEVNTNNELDSNYRLTLSDITGRRVYEEAFAGKELHIETKEFNPGFYVVVVTKENTPVFYSKIILQ